MRSFAVLLATLSLSTTINAAAIPKAASHNAKRDLGNLLNGIEALVEDLSGGNTAAAATAVDGASAATAASTATAAAPAKKNKAAAKGTDAAANTATTGTATAADFAAAGTANLSLPMVRGKRRERLFRKGA
ncbi:hypothetical protein RUND412_006062 [Rhizina undulata]